ncbi:MAG TPA: AAA family ATPase [Nostocaceae cyanobacterium]|nr:AAA family ATPase [Nostocaceae cyanobacterium]
MSQLFLSSLRTQNYKNLSFDKFVELRNINIFIGSNGSGKSNLINYLKFLQNCLNPNPDFNQNISSFSNALMNIGNGRILDNSVKSINTANTVGFVYGFLPTSQIGHERTGEIVLCIKILVTILPPMVFLGQEFLIERKHNSPNFIHYNFHEEGTRKGKVAVYKDNNQHFKADNETFETLDNIPLDSLGLAIIPKLLENSKYPPENIPVYKVRRDIINFVAKWRFYNANEMNLYQIRTSEPKIGGNNVYLSASGENLALVLENLIQEDIDFEDTINQAMKSILPKTRRIKPIRSGRLSLTVAWYFEDNKEPFYLSEMSDGTVRMLCWAIILHSPVLPSLLVIDEPELGLHVSWMRILSEWIKEASTKTQVIITTHSPDLLDHFTDCLENVYCFYSEDQSHFSMKPLSQEMLADKLEEGWQLGDLYRVGDPSVGGWPW